MKKWFIIAFSLLLTMGAPNASGQSLLKKIGNAVQKEVKKEVNKAIDKAVDTAVDQAIDEITNPQTRAPKESKPKKEKVKQEQEPQRNQDLIRRPEPERWSNASSTS